MREKASIDRELSVYLHLGQGAKGVPSVRQRIGISSAVEPFAKRHEVVGLPYRVGAGERDDHQREE